MELNNRYSPFLPESALDKSSPELRDGVSAYSGSDTTAYIFLPALYTKKQLEQDVQSFLTTSQSRSVYRKLGSLSYISLSSTRSKSMVTSLGRATGLGYTRGVRVITGVMTFLQLDRTAFYPLYSSSYKKNSYSGIYKNTTLADELPPFDLLLTYVNERGSVSYRVISHVEIVQSQHTDSIDDVNPLEVFSFVALRMTPLIPLTPSRGRGKDAISDGDVDISNSKFKLTSNTISPLGLTPSNTTFQDPLEEQGLLTPVTIASSKETDISIDTPSPGGVVAPSGKTFPGRS